MRIFAILLATVTLLSVSYPALAQTPDDAASLPKRLELAKKMQDLRPVRDQVDKAIDLYVQKLPDQEREATRAALKGALNYQALEKISLDAMAETYTEQELKAMVEYYSKPEAQSAGDKYEIFAGKVYPEIGRMLDKAMMRVKTGGAQ